MELSRPNLKSFPGSGLFILFSSQSRNSVRRRETHSAAKGLGGKSRGKIHNDVTPVTSETFTEDPNLVNEPSTDETVLADIEPSTDDLASATDKNTTTDCRDEKFACTRLYSVHRPVKQCIHQLCFTSLRRMYIINNEICSRLVCKEHEVMKDELCRQMAGLPPRRLRRSNYFRLPPCENVNLQRPSGL
ncbi:microfibrillar-associated protein 5 isoform X2 [Ailuropoda melanoleuca]|uniref:microfibrillar-associated protein 5 isoform X2 n=1 Tax=Ailuropoda melanoleuca TaxID=9646 RepID=UPI001493FF84|nr:microfibrillar-associated protein 5 isoform X2 [Ailuropoda melanoleuca]